MLKCLAIGVLGAALSWPLLAIEPRHGVVTGTIERLDTTAHTMVVKLANGTEHTFHFLKRTAVDGEAAADTGAEDAFHGLKQGGQVAVHYTAKGADESADEVDNLGKGGLQSTEATVTKVDREAKTLSVRTADGATETYRLTDGAAMDADKDATDAARKSTKVTIYYSQQGGHKIAHFFKKAIQSR